MRNVCIIPARGGSKRIPRKNIKEFLGRPIIAYSIEAAVASGLFEEVIVSTDDAQIASVAVSHGASVPFMRSSRNADDHAGTVDVLAEVHRQLDVAYDAACCLYPTAPFATAALLRRSHVLLLEQNYDCVFPVTRFSYPIQRALRRSDHGKTTMMQPEYRDTRSQDLEVAYHDCGLFYFYRPLPVLTTGTLWTENTGTIIVPESVVQDIDVPEDWAIAEIKYRLL